MYNTNNMSNKQEVNNMSNKQEVNNMSSKSAEEYEYTRELEASRVIYGNEIQIIKETFVYKNGNYAEYHRVSAPLCEYAVFGTFAEACNFLNNMRTLNVRAKEPQYCVCIEDYVCGNTTALYFVNQHTGKRFADELGAFIKSTSVTSVEVDIKRADCYVTIPEGTPGKLAFTDMQTAATCIISITDSLATTSAEWYPSTRELLSDVLNSNLAAAGIEVKCLI